MVKYLVVSFAGGILFGVLDGLIHANPLAQRLYEVYKPIARTSVNAPAGILIDLVYGFVTAGLFLLLYKSMPGSSGWLKGLGFGVLVWIFRVVMSAASQWVMFNLPARTIAYSVLTGLGEMVILGLLFGLTLRPAP